MAIPQPTYNLQSFDYLRRVDWTRESFDSRTPLEAEQENLVACAAEPFSVIPRQPVLLRCGDCLCWECLMKLDGATCPRCRTPIIDTEVRHFSQFTPQEARIISAFTDVDCHFACGYHGPATRVIEHEKEQCRLRDVKCPNKACFVVGRAQDILGTHLGVCPRGMEGCQQCRLPTYRVPNGNPPHNCLVEALNQINGKVLIF